MPYCKFCEQEVDKLVDCHIIPRAFFEHMKKWGNIDAMPVYNNFPNLWPKGKSRIGWYDSEIVCENCEKFFGPFDEYAIKLLLRTGQKQFYDTSGNSIGWKIDNYDSSKLKLFFMSTIWRIGASEREEFKRINLGSHLDILKEYIVKNDPGDVDIFSVILTRFPDQNGQHFQLNPHKEGRGVFGQVNFYRLYIGAGYVAHIKVDKRPLVDAGQWLFIALQKDSPLLITSRSDSRKSEEFKLMAKMVQNSVAIERKTRNK